MFIEKFVQYNHDIIEYKNITKKNLDYISLMIIKGQFPTPSALFFGIFLHMVIVIIIVNVNGNN